MSDLLKDPMILRQIIMDHYEYPRNRRLVDDTAYCKAHMAAESCIDDITVMTKIEGVVLQDLCFDGVACTISTASTSIMTDLLKGKSLAQAQHIIEEYYKMIELESYDASSLDEAVAFHQVGKQANRINCATIGVKAIEQCIKEHQHEQSK